ncbi:hypothetical protein RIF29_40098 [Crotalaria pallida]|uniref:Dolichyl-diphosphooligosaccharide--protein glycosyltransferase subunit 4A n=1 Tax=Crotalaria pallida TaxID=3830 RepID=A0AAN9E445_CROPI
MIDDNDLGFFANFLGIFIFVLVIAYHYVVADPNLGMPFLVANILICASKSYAFLRYHMLICLPWMLPEDA